MPVSAAWAASAQQSRRHASSRSLSLSLSLKAVGAAHVLWECAHSSRVGARRSRRDAVRVEWSAGRRLSTVSDAAWERGRVAAVCCRLVLVGRAQRTVPVKLLDQVAPSLVAEQPICVTELCDGHAVGSARFAHVLEVLFLELHGHGRQLPWQRSYLGHLD